MTPGVTVLSGRNHVQFGQNQRIFHCDTPLHPRYRSSAARKDTFASWPRHIAATSDQMADAGLFYTGIRDKTKCFYCNGGLERWEYDDDPMVEHAKWFPQCEYVLQKSGVEFVSSVTSSCPGLNRPPMPTTSYTVTSGNVLNVTNTSVTYHGASHHTHSTNEAYDIPPRPSRQNRLESAIEHELTESMKAMHFSEDLLKKVIERRLETSEMFENASEFLDAIQDMETRPNPPASQLPTPNERQTRVATGNVEIRIQEIRDERRCKICLDHESECVFNPCGHLCTCMDCARRLSSCPICRRHISRAMKFYTA